jgi:hypothetical protein
MLKRLRGCFRFRFVVDNSGAGDTDDVIANQVVGASTRLGPSATIFFGVQ